MVAKCLRGLRGDGGEVPLHDMHEIGDEGHFARFTLHVIRRRSELALFNRIMEYIKGNRFYVGRSLMYYWFQFVVVRPPLPDSRRFHFPK